MIFIMSTVSFGKLRSLHERVWQRIFYITWFWELCVHINVMIRPIYLLIDL